MIPPPPPPTLTFNYDISCPYAYIASTRLDALTTRTHTTLTYRPILLGALYRATAAPQGAAGSASDVFNTAKKRVGQRSLARTLRRYNIPYAAPALHPRKTVDALRLLYHVDAGHRGVLTHALFRAYWVQGRDVADRAVLLEIAAECGVGRGLTMEGVFGDAGAREELRVATAEALGRGAFGVPGFWVEGVRWVDVGGAERQGRYVWGQDRMHFVEGMLMALQAEHASARTGAGTGSQHSRHSHSVFPAAWSRTPHLRSLLPRAIPTNTLATPTRLEFWFDFSSPWAYLAYTQLPRLQRTFPGLTIELRPFVLGILFREIGAPQMPALAVSAAKAAWSRQDHADWTAWWNAVGEQEGDDGTARVAFEWATVFPIRSPALLRVGIVEPRTVPVLYSACWSQNLDVASPVVLDSLLTTAGFNAVDLLARANSPAAKTKLRELTAEAKDLGICGAPTYRVLRQNQSGGWDQAGGLVWGQDEVGVLEDLIAGWDWEGGREVAVPGKVVYEMSGKGGAKL